MWILLFPFICGRVSDRTDSCVSTHVTGIMPLELCSARIFTVAPRSAANHKNPSSTKKLRVFPASAYIALCVRGVAISCFLSLSVRTLERKTTEAAGCSCSLPSFHLYRYLLSHKSTQSKSHHVVCVALPSRFILLYRAHTFPVSLFARRPGWIDGLSDSYSSSPHSLPASSFAIIAPDRERRIMHNGSVSMRDVPPYYFPPSGPKPPPNLRFSPLPVTTQPSRNVPLLPHRQRRPSLAYRQS